MMNKRGDERDVGPRGTGLNTGLNEDAVIAALRGVNDPELHRDLVSLGMVKEVKVEGVRVAVRIDLTTPACPLKGKIEADVRAAIGALPGVGGVELSFGAQVTAASQGGDQGAIPGVKNIIAVGSGKGGVGKSTVAANLAASLAL
ncbi:hypothetical protein BH24DEI1_BH24DEI1_04580 [soil metagenome]